MKAYFASDIHLGAPIIDDKRTHERKFVEWLDYVEKDADAIYLLGDVFDYWYEYRTVAPRGYIRFLGKLCSLTDKGIEVHIFTGNHDVWMFGYLQEECGVKVHSKHEIIEINGKRLFIGHGDGLGNYDRGYNLLKWVFNCKAAQWCYSLLHPDIAGLIATTWSFKSRKRNNKKIEAQKAIPTEKEFQIQYALEYIKRDDSIDYFVFGHRHILKDVCINDKSRVIIIGDWLYNFSYAVMDEGEINLFKWENREPVPTTQLHRQ
jgi:UDP-2,3-diacylglucosamine hydrolase